MGDIFILLLNSNPNRYCNEWSVIHWQTSFRSIG